MKSRKSFRILGAGLLVWIILAGNGYPLKFERRPTGPIETSWFIYPVFSKLPGVGELAGVGGTVSGIAGSEVDVTGLALRGKGLTGEPLSFNLLAVLDIPIFTPIFTVSAGMLDIKNGTVAQYGRGRDSKKENRVIFKASKVQTFLYEFSVHLFEDQLELYYGNAYSTIKPEAVLKPISDDDFKEFKLPEGQEAKSTGSRFGIYLDDTDSRRDPRIGYRVQYEQYFVPKYDESPSYNQHDYNFTAFIPTNPKLSNVLVLNMFYGTVTIKEKGKVLPERYQCPPNSPAECQEVLDQIKLEAELNASLGKATSLGGPNRLRSYPSGRFYDAYTLFFGIEDRYYILEDYQPFNYFVQKGIFTGLQLAPFLEFGQVSPKLDSTLLENMKTSYGLGLRVLFNTTVLRLDYALGAEGSEITVFVGYPF